MKIKDTLPFTNYSHWASWNLQNISLDDNSSSQAENSKPINWKLWETSHSYMWEVDQILTFQVCSLLQPQNPTTAKKNIYNNNKTIAVCLILGIYVSINTVVSEWKRALRRVHRKYPKSIKNESYLYKTINGFKTTKNR